MQCRVPPEDLPSGADLQRSWMVEAIGDAFQMGGGAEFLGW